VADFALLVIVLLFLIWIGAALWNWTGTGDAWDSVGRGQWSMEHGKSVTGPAPAETPAERDADLRSMLEARNARRIAKGLEPLDVDAEMSRLDSGGDAPQPDGPELEAEVRSVVTARNERRQRAGKEPLDVEAEVARLLRGS